MSNEKTMTGELLQKVVAVIPESREDELRKELPDLFGNPEVRIDIVTDHVFEEWMRIKGESE